MEHPTSSVCARTLSVLLLAAGLPLAAGCMRPPAEPPGLGEQPTWHYERNPATLPSAPAPGFLVGAAESVDDPDSLGTVVTPPGYAAEPMDEASDNSAFSAHAHHDSARGELEPQLVR